PPRVVGVQGYQPREEVVAAEVAHEHSPGGEDVCGAGDDDLADAQLGGERDGVHASAAAEGDEREIARVVAPVQGDELESVDHVVVGDADDAARRFGRVDAETAGGGGQRALDRAHVRLDLAAAEIVAVDPTEREVRVGGRRLGAASAVRGGAGDGAGGLRADVELAEVVDPRDASAALADLDEVDDGDEDRIAGGKAAALDPVVGDDPHLPVLDQRALRGGAADVEGDDVRLADEPAQLGRAPETARRARLDHRDGDLACLLDRVDAAVRLHDVQLSVEPPLAHSVREPGQIPLG